MTHSFPQNLDYFLEWTNKLSGRIYWVHLYHENYSKLYGMQLYQYNKLCLCNSLGNNGRRVVASACTFGWVHWDLRFWASHTIRNNKLHVAWKWPAVTLDSTFTSASLRFRCFGFPLNFLLIFRLPIFGWIWFVWFFSSSFGFSLIFFR